MRKILLIIFHISALFQMPLFGQDVDAVTYFNPNNKDHRLTLFIMNERQLMFSMSFGVNSGIDAVSGSLLINQDGSSWNKVLYYGSDGIELLEHNDSIIPCRINILIDTTDYRRIKIKSRYCSYGNFKQFLKDSITMLIDSSSNLSCLEKLKQKTRFQSFRNQLYEYENKENIYKYHVSQEYADELNFIFECRNKKTNKLLKSLKGTAKSSNFGYEEMDIPVYKKKGDPSSGVEYYEATEASCFEWEDNKGKVIGFRFDPSDSYLLIIEYHEKKKMYKPFWSTNEAMRVVDGAKKPMK